MIRLSLLVAFVFSLSNCGYSQETTSQRTSPRVTNPNDQSEELGKVTWHRDYDEALALSKQQSKPVLILFQEVPGCSTCRNYGHNVLSHPLMVDAIENEFIPLAIYNNKGGADREVLNLYKEPTWNNPVVRIVNQTGQNLTNRVAGNYSATGLYSAMEAVLLKEKKVIPEYMKVLKSELFSTNSTTDEKYYQMYCFWTGERHLGAKDGVVKTEAGFMNGAEVVKVTYDKSKIEESDLDNHGVKGNCRPISSSDEGKYSPSEKDHYYQLQHSEFKYLPLTEIQKTKINSNLTKGADVLEYLSPTQKVWLYEMIENKREKQVLYNKDFTTAWAQLSKN